MAKFYGNIGFAIHKETAPGVYRPVIQTRAYSGDVVMNYRKWENSGNVNDNLNISNRISIIADKFCLENLGSMKFVEYIGARWKITNAELSFPRIILTIGGVYNGASDQLTSDLV